MQAAGEEPGNSTTVAGSLLGEYEWLAARVLSFTDPATACRAACVNRTFRAASSSDMVWLRLLPPRALAIIRNQADPDDDHDTGIDTTADIDDGHHRARSTLAERLLCLPSRQLFFRLCKSIPLSGGTQRYWLDPATGAECYILSSKALTIVWGSTPQYWGWIPSSGSWFPIVAYLRSVCWFLMEGTWRQSLSRGSYVVSFRLKVGGAGGWDRSPVKLSLQNLSSGKQIESQCFFDSQHQNSFPPSSPPAFSFSSTTTNKNNNQNNDNENDTNENHSDTNETCANDNNDANDNENDSPGNDMNDSDSDNSTCEHDDAYQDSEEEDDDDDENEHDDAYQDSAYDDDENAYPWVECDVGEFHVDDDDADHPVEIMFTMRETEVLWWKSGIFVDGVIIRPVHVVNEGRKGFAAPPHETRPVEGEEEDEE